MDETCVRNPWSKFVSDLRITLLASILARTDCPLALADGATFGPVCRGQLAITGGFIRDHPCIRLLFDSTCTCDISGDLQRAGNQRGAPAMAFASGCALLVLHRRPAGLLLLEGSQATLSLECGRCIDHSGLRGPAGDRSTAPSQRPALSVCVSLADSDASNPSVMEYTGCCSCALFQRPRRMGRLIAGLIEEY